MKFIVVKVKDKKFLITIDEHGVTDTIHELKLMTNINANWISKKLINCPDLLEQLGEGIINNNLVD